MENLPYYLTMGMTSDEYWNGDVWLVKAYRESWKQREENDNMLAWLQGYYTYHAVGTALSQAFGGRAKYTEPIELHPREKTAEEIIEEYYQRLSAWGERFNERYSD